MFLLVAILSTGVCLSMIKYRESSKYILIENPEYSNDDSHRGFFPDGDVLISSI